MGKKQSIKSKLDIVPEGVPAPYGIRKTFNHVVNFKKKRTNSLVKMKPLKERQNYYDVPEFCPDGYTREQFDLYREEFQRIRQLTKEDLKQILKLNKQDTNVQSRAQILNRCADGYALGKIPRCTHCYGTNPIYDKYKGTYFCPGYKQGENFVKCDSMFSRDEIKRLQPWNNNFEHREAIRLDRTEKKMKHERIYQIQYKKAKKRRLARQARRQKGEPSSQEQYQDKQKNSQKREKREKAQALIKRQAVGAAAENEQQERKIQSERE